MIGLVAAAAVGVPPALRGRELYSLPTHRKVVALTLDAGGDAVRARSLLRTLKRMDAVATFFLTGRWVNRYPGLARTIGRRYPVANHTYHHLHLTSLSDGAVAHEITSAGRAIRRRTGHSPRPLFRFPYGDSDARTIAIANRLGYISIRWTVDSLGWMGSPGQTVSGAIRRVVSGIRPGAIVLMHVGSSGDGRTTIDTRALAGVIDGIRRRGYSFTTFPYRR